MHSLEVLRGKPLVPLGKVRQHQLEVRLEHRPHRQVRFQVLIAKGQFEATARAVALQVDRQEDERREAFDLGGFTLEPAQEPQAHEQNADSLLLLHHLGVSVQREQPFLQRLGVQAGLQFGVYVARRRFVGLVLVR